MACFVLAAAFLCLHVSAPDAYSARVGGGKSFGGKPSYTRTAPAPRTAQQQQGAYADKRNPAQNPAANAARSGMTGSGFRGMIGGLLAGSLLGALLFGAPHSGFGIMDMVFAALLAFMALKLIRMFLGGRAPAETVGRGSAPPEDYAFRPDPWRAMEGSPGASGGTVAGGPDIRLDGFDQDDFLRGAKIVYIRLQEAWDKRDVEDIAAFATPAILNEVTAQAEADPNPSKTEIMLVNASLVSAERDGDDDVATVLFDVLLRENPEAQVPAQVRELWHFIRPADSARPWRLDGIQQVE